MEGCVRLSPKYKIYDLCVESEIPLEGVGHLDDSIPADVTARYGKMSIDARAHPLATIYGDKMQWWNCAPDREHVMFNCYAGEIEIFDGREITVNPAEDAPIELIRTFLMGSAIGAAQIQRGRIPIHGGSLEADGKAFIITGQQGAGKSTLTSAFVAQGYPFLADDVSVAAIDEKTNVPMALPAFPQRKLCRDACVQLGYDPEKLVMIDETRDKLAIRSADGWTNQSIPLGWMFEIVPQDATMPLEAERVDGRQRLAMLMRSLYRPWIHHAIGILPNDFKRLLAIASGVEMYRIFRPNNISRIDEIIACILDRIKNN